MFWRRCVLRRRAVRTRIGRVPRAQQLSRQWDGWWLLAEGALYTVDKLRRSIRRFADIPIILVSYSTLSSTAAAAAAAVVVAALDDCRVTSLSSNHVHAWVAPPPPPQSHTDTVICLNYIQNDIIFINHFSGSGKAIDRVWVSVRRIKFSFELNELLGYVLEPV